MREDLLCLDRTPRSISELQRTKIDLETIKNLSKAISREVCSQEQFLQQFSENQPPYSECARFLKRPLSWATWIPGWSDADDDSWVGYYNKAFSHEHIFFDQSRDQVGFGEHGLFVEDPNGMGYRDDERCFDGSLVRVALGKVGVIGAYNFLLNNCQSFAERVRNSVQKLTKNKNQN